MFSLKIFTVLLLASCVFADDKITCENDSEDNCLVAGMKKFLVELAPGKSEIGIKPLDPMVVTNINVAEESIGTNSYFPELKVTGLKEAVVKSITKTQGADVASLELKYNLVAEGPVSLQFPKKNKELKGTIKYEAVIDGTITDLFTPSKTTYSCEASNAKYTIPEDLIQLQEKDSDASAVEAAYDKLHDEHVKKVACEINKAVLTQIVETFTALQASGKKTV